MTRAPCRYNNVFYGLVNHVCFCFFLKLLRSLLVLDKHRAEDQRGDSSNQTDEDRVAEPHIVSLGEIQIGRDNRSCNNAQQSTAAGGVLSAQKSGKRQRAGLLE